MKFDFRNLTDELEHAHSSRIALRPVSLADAWPIFEASRNERFNQHLLWPQPKDEDEVLTRLKTIAVASRKGDMAGVSAVVKKTGEFISLFKFQSHATRQDAIEMGVWTHDKFWHGRYSLELGRLCVSAAFSLSNVQALVGAASPENRSSCKLMQAVGMEPLSLTLRESEKGNPVLLQEYVIGRSAWVQSHSTAFGLFRPLVPLAASQPREPVNEPA